MSTRRALSTARSAAPGIVGVRRRPAAGLAALVLAAAAVRVPDVAAANLRRYSAPSAWAYDAVLAPLLGGLYRHIADDAAAVAPRRPHRSVLEIGGGPGHVAVLLARRGPDATIAAADIDPAMVARATNRVAREGAKEDGVVP